jgi:allophanate hydrolase subunit 2
VFAWEQDIWTGLAPFPAFQGLPGWSFLRFIYGGVQIPPDGRPIILLVEQTVGGYTKIATVVAADLPGVAQAKPGDKIRFEKVDLDSAYESYKQHEEKLKRIEESLQGRK